MSGPFIVLDGPDGVGKTKLLRHLAAALMLRGLVVACMSYPSDTIQGEIAHAGAERPWRAQACMFAADMYDHEDVERAHANRCDVVLCDRRELSTLAYQGRGHAPRERWILGVVGELRAADLTLVLTAPLDVRRARVAARGEVDSRDRDELDLGPIYERLARERGAVLIDASGTPEATLAAALKAVLDLLGSRP